MDNEHKLRDYLKRATADLRHSRQRVQELEAAAHEPIAIIGMACHYPGGVTDPDGLWDLLIDGRHGIGPFPDDRGWDLARLTGDGPGRSRARRRLPRRDDRVRRRRSSASPPRGPRHGPPAAAPAGDPPGRPSNAPASPPPHCAAAAPASSPAPPSRTTARSSPQPARTWTSTPPPATPPA
ncbi:polyketide synthase docking domain-containing protein [Streptomyces sp. KM273126]|nr:polyketide synthase docking domain-containing protein [Streptomyces sp. KM273126]